MSIKKGTNKHPVTNIGSISYVGVTAKSDTNYASAVKTIGGCNDYNLHMSVKEYTSYYTACNNTVSSNSVKWSGLDSSVLYRGYDTVRIAAAGSGLTNITSGYWYPKGGTSPKLAWDIYSTGSGISVSLPFIRGEKYAAPDVSTSYDSVNHTYYITAKMLSNTNTQNGGFTVYRCDGTSASPGQEDSGTTGGSLKFTLSGTSGSHEIFSSPGTPTSYTWTVAEGSTYTINCSSDNTTYATSDYPSKYPNIKLLCPQATYNATVVSVSEEDPCDKVLETHTTSSAGGSGTNSFTVYVYSSIQNKSSSKLKFTCPSTQSGNPQISQEVSANSTWTGTFTCKGPYTCSKA